MKTTQNKEFSPKGLRPPVGSMAASSADVLPAFDACPHCGSGSLEDGKCNNCSASPSPSPSAPTIAHRCSVCGGTEDHRDQITLYPSGSNVRFLEEITVEGMPAMTIPKGSIGTVTGHCADGRAFIVAAGGSHTFHHPQGLIELVPAAAERGFVVEYAGGLCERVIQKVTARVGLERSRISDEGRMRERMEGTTTIVEEFRQFGPDGAAWYFVGKITPATTPSTICPSCLSSVYSFASCPSCASKYDAAPGVFSLSPAPAALCPSASLEPLVAPVGVTGADFSALPAIFDKAELAKFKADTAHVSPSLPNKSSRWFTVVYKTEDGCQFSCPVFGEDAGFAADSFKEADLENEREIISVKPRVLSQTEEKVLAGEDIFLPWRMSEADPNRAVSVQFPNCTMFETSGLGQVHVERARFIVEACNSHATLKADVERLTGALNEALAMASDTKKAAVIRVGHVRNICRAALASAGA